MQAQNVKPTFSMPAQAEGDCRVIIAMKTVV